MENLLEDLPSNASSFLVKDNITTPEQLLTTSKYKFLSGGCTEDDVRILKEAAAKIVAQNVSPVALLFRSATSFKWSRISFGCAALDRCMRGGVVTRGITEICGAAGSGKTQLLLQLALTVQLPRRLGGLGKGVAFICTEGAFASKRLFQMCKAFDQRYPEENINYLSNIHVDSVIESDDLFKCVDQRLRRLMEVTSIGLIVIDSVAAVFRVYTDFLKRARDMRQLVHCLLHYIDKYNCAVICVNQVATVSDEEREVPCLGLAWAHLGRTRIKISKVPKQVNIATKLYTIRKFEVLYSPETPNEYAEFLITEQGIVDVLS